MKKFTEFVEGKVIPFPKAHKPTTVEAHVDQFHDIVGSGNGIIGDYHVGAMAKHAKSIQPEHRETVHKAIMKAIKTHGSYSDDEKKLINNAYKPKE